MKGTLKYWLEADTWLTGPFAFRRYMLQEAQRPDIPSAKFLAGDAAGLRKP